jgi:hypothetical protein
MVNGGVLALAVVTVTFGVGGCGRYWVCEPTDDARVALLPERLSGTGLYADIGTGRIAEGVLAYRPAFALWSDGADKRRWIYLPPGSRIDTSDMDEWEFPDGTKIWKEFSLAGTRLETRLFEKRGSLAGDWIAVAYVWNEDGKDAVVAPWGVVNARGTNHDVPAGGECLACHGGRRSRILGFSAIQLSPQPLSSDPSAAADAPGEVDLMALAGAGRLTDPPPGPFVVPGDQTERAALGYLHANCSHCHNQTRPSGGGGARCFDPRNGLDFSLSVGAGVSVAEAETYRTVVDRAVKRGDPDGSRLIDLVSHRGFLQQMPPLATEQVDVAAVATLRRWIEAL